MSRQAFDSDCCSRSVAASKRRAHIHGHAEGKKNTKTKYFKHLRVSCTLHTQCNTQTDENGHMHENRFVYVFLMNKYTCIRGAGT